MLTPKKLKKIDFSHLVIVFSATVCSLALYGIGLSDYEQPFYAALFHRSNQFNCDILAQFILNSAPVLFRIFKYLPNFYDIPLMHMVLGFIIKFFLLGSLYTLTYWKFKNKITATFSLIMLMGPWILIQFLLLVGSPEIRGFLQLSYRQLGTLFSIFSLIPFLSRKYLLASLLMGLAAYCHLLNTLHLFLIATIILLFRLVTNIKDYRNRFRDLLTFTIPFFVIMLPYILMNRSFLSSVTPISSFDWWRFIIKNEPDDMSIIYNVIVTSPKVYLVAIFLCAISALLLIAIDSNVNRKSIGNILKEENWLLFIIFPWLIAGLGYLWESHIKYFPDFINNIFIPFEFRRILWIPPLFAIPVFSYGIYLLAQKLISRVIKGPNNNFLKLKDSIIAMILILVVTISQVTCNWATLSKAVLRFLSLEHKSYDYLMAYLGPIYYEEPTRRGLKDKDKFSGKDKEETAYLKEINKCAKEGNFKLTALLYKHAIKTNPDNVELHNGYGNLLSLIGNTKDALREFQIATELALHNSYQLDNLAVSCDLVSHIPLDSLKTVCFWIKNKIPEGQGMFNPPYIKEVRSLTERPCFLSEKMDGNWAIFNRRFATVYLERFKHILKGLTYDQLPGIVFEGDIPYAIMRRRYLSLNSDDLVNLHKTYPDYRYILTEKSHNLPFRKLYENDYFRVYDINALETKDAL